MSIFNNVCFEFGFFFFQFNFFFWLTENCCQMTRFNSSFLEFGFFSIFFLTHWKLLSNELIQYGFFWFAFFFQFSCFFLLFEDSCQMAVVEFVYIYVCSTFVVLMFVTFDGLIVLIDIAFVVVCWSFYDQAL